MGQDPNWSERSFGWVSESATDYVRPVRRIAVRCRRIDGTFAYGILICSLKIKQVLMGLGRPAAQAADPVAVLLAYVTFYDQRGGGIETIMLLEMCDTKLLVTSEAKAPGPVFRAVPTPPLRFWQRKGGKRGRTSKEASSRKKRPD